MRLGDGHWRYDPKTREWVRLGEARSLANMIAGELVHCARGGETLDFGKGAVHVADSAEKARAMKEAGVMPWQGKMAPPKYDPNSMPSFSEHFYKEHGMPLSEAQGLVHLREG